MNTNQKDYSHKIIPWDETYRPGIGVDYMTRQARASILKNSGNIELQSVLGKGRGSQNVRSVLRRVESKEELVDTISTEISGSGSASVPTKGGGSGSFFGKFIDQTTINTYNVYLTLMVQVTNNTEYIKGELELDESLNKILTDNFSLKYGDHLIYGVKTGGLYLAVVEIVTRTEAKKQEVLTKLSGSGHYGSSPKEQKVEENNTEENKEETDKPTSKDNEIGKIESVNTGSAGASGTLNVMVSQAKTVTDTEQIVKVDRIGGLGSVSVSDPEGITKEAQQFPETVSKHGRVISAILRPYSLIKGLPDAALDGAYFQQYSYYRDLLTRRVLRAQSILENFDYALDEKHLKLFEETPEQLKTSHTKLVNYIATINTLLAELIQSPKNFLQDIQKLQSIPNMLELSEIPKRLNPIEKVHIAPHKFANPRMLANLITGLLLSESRIHLSVEARDELEKMGSFLSEFYQLIASSISRLVRALRKKHPKRVEIALNRVNQTLKVLYETVEDDLPELTQLFAKHLEQHGKGDSDVLNDANSVLSRIQANTNRTGGLFEFINPLSKTVKEIELVLKAKNFSEAIQYDQTEWELVQDRFHVAILRLGRSVRPGIHHML